MEIESIDTRELLHKRSPVKVINVASPTLFWVRLKSNEEEFHTFTAELNVKVAHNKIRVQDPKEQQHVVVKRDLLWLRGTITRILKRAQIAEIALRDIGRGIMVSTNEIYHLEDEFRKLPWQGICCGLAHIGNLSSRSKWTIETQKLARLLAEGDEAIMTIVQPVWPGAAFINLELKSRFF